MIQSDNGGEFNNDLMKDFLLHQVIKYVRCSPYHPQSQGAVEVFNRTVQNFLYLAKMFIKMSWPKWFYIQFLYAL